MAGREAARGTWWRPEVPPAGVGALAASVSSSHGTEGSPPPCPAMRREIRGLRKGREEEGGRPGACLQSVGERRFRNSPGRRGRASSAAAFGCRSSGPAGLPAPAPPGPGLTGRGPAPRIGDITARGRRPAGHGEAGVSAGSTEQRGLAQPAWPGQAFGPDHCAWGQTAASVPLPRPVLGWGSQKPSPQTPRVDMAMVEAGTGPMGVQGLRCVGARGLG